MEASKFAMNAVLKKGDLFVGVPNMIYLMQKRGTNLKTALIGVLRENPFVQFLLYFLYTKRVADTYRNKKYTLKLCYLIFLEFLICITEKMARISRPHELEPAL